MTYGGGCITKVTVKQSSTVHVGKVDLADVMQLLIMYCIYYHYQHWWRRQSLEITWINLVVAYENNDITDCH